MVLQLVYCLLLASLALPHCSFGEIVFRCPSCTAERLAACPKLTATCEVVREPGCGCCPVCARKEGEACGVYTPRCGNGFRCYPSPDAQLPLDQLVRGFGRCGPRVDLEHMSSHEFREISGEIYGTKSPAQKKTTKDPNYWHIREAVRQHQIEQRTRMLNRMEEPKTPRPRQVMQSHCQQELDRVLEDIAKMTFLDNKGPLENLYDLKFPNCDKEGQYNLKQCHMSNHGQRGECWCVNPHTGIQIPSSPKVRGDPNCGQFLGGPETEPPTAVQI